jgi:hypothetical protein
MTFSDLIGINDEAPASAPEPKAIFLLGFILLAAGLWHRHSLRRA